ncbi:MAG TPA: hypothetical protein PKU91_03115, partial [Phycisphaerales bacterium]|nr:hypothetical protein [Phycisphaerales bacterium]
MSVRMGRGILYSVIASPLLFAVVFASAQGSRWGVFRSLYQGLITNDGPRLGPVRTAELEGWYYRSESLLTNQGHALPGGVERAMTHLGPVWFPEPLAFMGFEAGIPLAPFLAAAAGLVIAYLITMIIVHLACRSAGRSDRPHPAIIADAISRGWVGQVVLAGMVAFAVWYIGFDRTGGSRSLMDGFVPSAAQVAFSVAIWAVGGAALAAYVHYGPAHKSFRSPHTDGRPGRCASCGYDLSGCDADRCSECAAESAPPPSPVFKFAHGLCLTAVSVLVLAVPTASMAINGLPTPIGERLPPTRERLLRWVMLRPIEPNLVCVCQLIPSRIVRVDTEFGSWWLMARPLDARGDAPEKLWELRTVFAGNTATEKELAVQLEKFEVPIIEDTPPRDARVSLTTARSTPVGVAVLVVVPGSQGPTLTMPSYLLGAEVPMVRRAESLDRHVREAIWTDLGSPHDHARIAAILA